MKLIILVILYLSINFSFSKYLTSKNESENNNTEIDAATVRDIIRNTFKSLYPNCSKSLDKMFPNTKITLSNFPFLQNIGKGLNDLGDEIECHHALNNGTYVIVDIGTAYITNKYEKRLIEFLNINHYSLGACITEECEEPFDRIIKTLLNFQDKRMDSNDSNITNGINSTNNSNIYIEEEDISNTNATKVIIILIICYLILKIIAGFIRLIYIPKGYEKYASKIMRKNEEKPPLEDAEEKLIKFSSKRTNSVIDLGTIIYEPKYDLSEKYPLYLRIFRFFDIFNDIMYLTTRINRYYNDKGLETLNFLRTIVLYFLIFYNTFTSLFKLPSRDILNQTFFSSKRVLFYRLSTHAITCWIFLEAAYSSYKLMQFIKTEMFKYYKKMKMNNNKNLALRLLKIFGTFILHFIPKFFMFLFCYFFFYYDIVKFKSWFNAKITYEYLTKRVIAKDIECNEKPFVIFYKFFTFKHKLPSKVCYDFTYVYINILFCILVFMILLYIVLLFQNYIIELIFIIINIILFIGLMFVIDDDDLIRKYEDSDENRYGYYHFRGQEYTNKFAYLALGIYHLGFIIGILYFNYESMKKSNENTKNKNEISINNYKLPYYPLSFLNKFLIWVNKLNAIVKLLSILILTLLMILLSLSYKFSSDKKDEHYDEGDNRDDNVLTKSFDQGLKFYFLFERHLFLILFFFINVIMITYPKKGFYKKLINSRLITSISRTGFIMTCLYYIIGNFSFCSFIIKIKFNLITFFIISIGNFIILFLFCSIFNIIFELPLRIGLKKLLRSKFEN